MAEVNLDIAMESTSQEILEKVNGLAPSVDGRCVKTTGNVALNTATTKTVFTVNGKGTFRGAFLADTHTKKTATMLTVTIDGTEYKVGYTCSTEHEGTRIILFVPHNGNLSVDDIVSYLGVQLLSSTASVKHCSFGSTIEGNRTGVVCATFIDSLPFEESLSVSVTTRGTSNLYHVWYTLEE